ncbi:MAG: ABC transporter ATP-binding protein [Acidimicrobiales bacterium]
MSEIDTRPPPPPPTFDSPRAEPLLVVDDLKTHFPIKAGLLRRQVGTVFAVDGVSFAVDEHETLGIVGESGCGKTTLGRSVLRLIQPTSGSVRFGGREITTLPLPELRRLRKEIQIVFQDPYASLNARWPVNDIIGEPLRVHGASKAEARGRAGELLEAVGLLPEHGNRYPHEFSGGQRQRIGIARALALKPRLIVLDEPVSALDVSVQAQVINLLEDLQDEFGLTYMFIAHDLSVVRHISDRIMVMYLGHVMEEAPAQVLHDAPAHPYTHALLSAAPIADPDVESTRRRVVLEGDLPSPANPPSGCPFRTRCPLATEKCAAETPVLAEVSPGHRVACHYPLAPGQRLADLVANGARPTVVDPNATSILGGTSDPGGAR